MVYTIGQRHGFTSEDSQENNEWKTWFTIYDRKRMERIS
jgi:hypothetical protein